MKFYSSEKPIYYFAYGMLTDPALMTDARLLSKATLKNFKFNLVQFANVTPSNGDEVHGALWEIDQDTLDRLDMTEGYPELYDRQTVSVLVEDEEVAAQVYVMTPNTKEWLNNTRPTKYYINRLYEGYTNAGIPLQQLTGAL